MSFWAFSDTLCKFPNPQGHCVLNWVLGGGFVRKSVHWLKWICFTQILLKVSKYHKKNWYFPNLKKKKHLQCFAITLQVNFPSHYLNFHWRWRWWDWIQATFTYFFYFNNVHTRLPHKHQINIMCNVEKSKMEGTKKRLFKLFCNLTSTQWFQCLFEVCCS